MFRYTRLRSPGNDLLHKGPEKTTAVIVITIKTDKEKKRAGKIHMKRAPLATIGFVPPSLVVPVMKSSCDHISELECWRSQNHEHVVAAEYIHVGS